MNVPRQPQPPTFADLTSHNLQAGEDSSVEGASELSVFEDTRVESITLQSDCNKSECNRQVDSAESQIHDRWLREEIRKLRHGVDNLPRCILAEIREVFADFEMKSMVQKEKEPPSPKKQCRTPVACNFEQPLKRPAPFVQFQAENSGGSLLVPFERRTLRTHTANTELPDKARGTPEPRSKTGTPVAVHVISSPEMSCETPSPRSEVMTLKVERIKVVTPPPLPSATPDYGSSYASNTPVPTPTATVPCDIPLLEKTDSPLFGRPEDCQDQATDDMRTTAILPGDQGQFLRKGNSLIQKAVRAKNATTESGRGCSRWRVIHIVQSPMFDYVSAGLVIINAITIGLQTDYMARNMTDKASTPYRIVDICFCIAFTVEIALRAVALGSRFVRPPDGKWNIFDLVLVSLQVSDEILSNYTNWQNKSRINFSVLRIVRILRLIRIMRLVRILRLVGELRTIIASILGSLRPLFYTIFLLFMFIYVFAVYLTQLVLDFRVDVKPADDAPEDVELNYYYGSLARSIFSLYQAISGGIDWDALADPLMKRISVFLGFVLAAYTAFCLLALMNVVTGVFVEAAMESAKKDRASYILGHVKELFKKADPENIGTLNWDRFQSSLNEEFMQEIFKTIDVCLSEARSVFSLLDSDDSGEIELDEFLNGCLGLHGPAKAVHLATLMYETRIATRFHAQHISHIEQLIIQILDAMHVAHGAQPAISGELARRKTFVLEDGAQFPVVQESEGPEKAPRRFSFELDPQVAALKALVPGVVHTDSTTCTDTDR